MSIPDSDKDRGIPSPDPGLDDLRAILVGQDRAHIAELEAQVRDLERRVEDRDALIAMLMPVMGEAIRRKIRDSREEMVEALYPIIGQLVVRAVSEAMRDLARSIDARMRTSFDLKTSWRRIKARASGVSSSEMVLRESLPFSVTEVFLIHRETGLLLRYVARAPDLSPDSELVSGMLTAIRDFVHDAFGRDKVGQLDAIQYGDRRILIEASRHAYLAVVADGVEPPGFRAEMRERLIEIQNGYNAILQDYDGDAARLAPVDGMLRSLMAATPATELSTAQKRILAGVGGLLVLCVVATCLAGAGIWHSMRGVVVSQPTREVPPQHVGLVVAPTASPTWTATATPWPTHTVTPLPTATKASLPTATPAPTATATVLPSPTAQPKAVVLARRLNVRAGPGTDYAVITVVEAGQTLGIVGRNEMGDWWEICCVLSGRIGWISARFVTAEGFLEAVPVVTGRALPSTPASG